MGNRTPHPHRHCRPRVRHRARAPARSSRERAVVFRFLLPDSPFPALARASLRRSSRHCPPGRSRQHAAPAGVPGPGGGADRARRAGRLAEAGAQPDQPAGAAAVGLGRAARPGRLAGAGARRQPCAAGQGKPCAAQRTADRQGAPDPAADGSAGQRAAARAAGGGRTPRPGRAAGADPGHRPGPDPAAPGAGCRRPRRRARRPGGDRRRRADGPGDRGDPAAFHRAAADRSGPCGAGDGGAQRRAPDRLRPRRHPGAARRAAQRRGRGRRRDRHLRPGRALPGRLPGRHRGDAAPGRHPCLPGRQSEAGGEAGPGAGRVVVEPGTRDSGLGTRTRRQQRQRQRRCGACGGARARFCAGRWPGIRPCPGFCRVPSPESRVPPAPKEPQQ